MDFFKAQEAARRRTWQLGVLFAAAIIALIVLTNLFVVLAGAFLTASSGGSGGIESLASTPPSTWAWITVGVLGVVGTASLYKYLRLRGGGRVVAESFGGRLLSREQATFEEQRALNVVEEMAIAAGVPVPPVYVLEEPGINAFAAGHTIEDAVIGINRGTIELLGRDELQGVVAHEFSHILNGDMNINLRLIAVLHGILFIGLIGRLLLRSAGNASRRNGLPILLFGAGFAVIGYGGTFFGNLIKAAVSRQREYLADAAAVQFTRNPGGIAGALKKIGGHITGSGITNGNAQEASHLFFAAVAPRFIRFLFATHPPLENRIRAIEPRWDGKYPVVSAETIDKGLNGKGLDRTPPDYSSAGATSAMVGNIATPETIVDSVGNPGVAAVEQAHDALTTCSSALSLATQEPYGATALVYAVLLSPDAGIRTRQQEAIAEHGSPGMAAETTRLYGLLSETDPVARSMLIDRAIPALKTLSTGQYRTLLQVMAFLVDADHRMDLLEWMTSLKLSKDLSPHFLGTQTNRMRFNSIGQVSADLIVLLASLSTLGKAPEEQRLAAFTKGLQIAGVEPASFPAQKLNFSTMSNCMFRLRDLAPLQKPKVLKAVVATLMYEQQLNTSDAALLHLIAGALDCPLPPVPLYGRS